MLNNHGIQVWQKSVLKKKYRSESPKNSGRLKTSKNTFLLDVCFCQSLGQLFQNGKHNFLHKSNISVES